MNFSIIESLVFKVNTAKGSGTCFFLNEQQIFVTNFHVVNGCHVVSVENNKQERMMAEVILADPGADLALLRVSTPIVATDLMFNTEPLFNTQKVSVAGYPYGMPYCITQGIISSVNQVLSNQNFIQIDAAINPGNSGGPVLDEQGNLIGIVASKFTEADNMGFAIPVARLEELIGVLKIANHQSYAIKCTSCDTVIVNRSHYCPSCGAGLEESWFDEYELSFVGRFCEDAMAKAGINPVLMRAGHEFWVGHSGSAELRIFISGNYIYATSPLNKMPRQNTEAILSYLLSNPLKQYQLGLSDNMIYISYRFPLGGIHNEKLYETMLNDLAGLVTKADEMDDYLQQTFGCEKAVYAKNVVIG
ncbi:trypsin-like peptidase domain-containing protein [Pedobacter sp. UC225_61]|uniref:trypsin-like peptidase domain-containing protein n=1 Tax=Pedobacter sp. UC225_61 TaxID=3374623 RepID=UPI0037882164